MRGKDKAADGVRWKEPEGCWGLGWGWGWGADWLVKGRRVNPVLSGGPTHGHGFLNGEGVFHDC